MSTSSSSLCSTYYRCEIRAAIWFLTLHPIPTGYLLGLFGWDIATHPPYSPDPTPTDYHSFDNLKELLGGQRFLNNEVVMETEKVASRGGAE
ncbi:hypothetical protein J437_LFUL000295, partial [Ladona fulva]